MHISYLFKVSIIPHDQLILCLFAHGAMLVDDLVNCRLLMVEVTWLQKGSCLWLTEQVVIQEPKL